MALESTPQGIVAEYPLGLDPDQLSLAAPYDRRFLGGVPEGTPGQADDARRALIDPAVRARQRRSPARRHRRRCASRRARDRRRPSARGGFRVGLGLSTRDEKIGRDVGMARQRAGRSGARDIRRRVRQPHMVESTGVGYPLVSPSGVATLELATRTPGRSAHLRGDSAESPPGPCALRMRHASSPTRSTGRRGSLRSSLSRADDRMCSSRRIQPQRRRTDAILVAAARATAASGAPALRAVPISADAGF